MYGVLRVFIVLTACVLLRPAGPVWGQEQEVLVLLPLAVQNVSGTDTDGGGTQEQLTVEATRMTSVLQALIEQSDRFTPITARKITSTMMANVLKDRSLLSTLARGIAPDVDYVMAGYLNKQNNEYALNVYLVEVARQTNTRDATLTYSGTLADLESQLPSAMAYLLDEPSGALPFVAMTPVPEAATVQPAVGTPEDIPQVEVLVQLPLAVHNASGTDADGKVTRERVTEDASRLTSALQTLVGQSGRFTLMISRKITSGMMANVLEKPSLQSTLARGIASDADYVTTGSLNKHNSEYTLNLRLVEVARQRSIRDTTLTHNGTLADLENQLPSAMAYLLDKPSGALPVVAMTPASEVTPVQQVAPQEDTPQIQANTSPDLYTLLIIYTPADATVTIDGRRVGAVGQGIVRVTVAAGEHTLQVTRDGYKAYRRNFDVIENQRIDVTLTGESGFRSKLYVLLGGLTAGAGTYLYIRNGNGKVIKQLSSSPPSLPP